MTVDRRQAPMDPSDEALEQARAALTERHGTDSTLEDARSAPVGGGADGDAWARLQGALTTERSGPWQLRSLSTPARRGLAILWMGLPVLFWWAFKSRVDAAEYPLGRWIVELGAALAVGATLAVLATRPLQRLTLPRGPALALLGFATALLLLPMVMPAAHTGHPESLLGVGDDFARRAAKCFGAGLATSIPVVGGLLLLDRGAGRVGATTWLLCGAGFAVSTAALFLHCPLTSPTHIITGHGGVLLPLAAAGLLLGWRASRRHKR